MRRLALATLWLMVFAIPLENMLVLPGVGSISRIAGGLCFAVGFVTILLERENRPPGLLQGTFGIFVLWSLLSVLWSIDLDNTRTALFTLVQLYLFVWLIWEFGREEKDLLGLMTAYVAGCYGACAATFMAFAARSQFAYGRYAAQGFDPNDLGLTLALGVPLAWYLKLRRGGGIGALASLYPACALFAIILTASRTALIAYVATLLFLVLTLKRIPVWERIALLVAVPLVVAAFQSWAPSYSLERLATIGAELSQGSLNSRLTIWEYGLRAFVESPVWGFGSGTFGAALEALFGFRVSPHNMFLSILVGGGLVGLLLIGLVFVTALAGLRHLPPLERGLWLVLFLALGIGVSALNWEHGKPTWLFLALLAAHVGLFRVASGAEATEGTAEPEQGGEDGVPA